MNLLTDALRLADTIEKYFAALDAPLENNDLEAWSKRYDSAESNVRAALRAYQRKKARQ